MARSKKAMKTETEYTSILEASDFWDEHSLLDFPDVKEVKNADLSIEGEVYYCPLSRGLLNRLQERARIEGVSTETLVNLYLQEKLAQP
jgi:hypothetical protein